MKLLIYGMPGSGKGTASKTLCDLYEIPHISTGDLLRAEVAKDSVIGRQIKHCMESGNLVSDDLLSDLVKKTVRKKEGFVLDGWPRNQDQAADLVINVVVDAMIYLKVDQEVVIKRMLERKRSDDTPEVIKHRLQVYEEQTKPVLSYLINNKARRWPIFSIDSNASIENVNDAIILKLTELQQRGRFGIEQENSP